MKPDKVNRGLTFWTRDVPIILAISGFIFGIFQWWYSTKISDSQKHTWADKKETYQDMITLIGEIGAAKNNDSLLRVLKPKFDAFYIAKMKHAEGNDSLLILKMMMMRRDLDNAITGKEDYYSEDRLERTCKTLTDQISAAIEKGNREY